MGIRTIVKHDVRVSIEVLSNGHVCLEMRRADDSLIMGCGGFPLPEALEQAALYLGKQVLSGPGSQGVRAVSEAYDRPLVEA